MRLEDALVYTEPTEWHYPPRLALGAMLLEAGRPAEAETVYWEDLKRNRENGWAVRLAQALARRARTSRRRDSTRFDKAWARADVKLTASRRPGRSGRRARGSKKGIRDQGSGIGVSEAISREP